MRPTTRSSLASPAACSRSAATAGSAPRRTPPGRSWRSTRSAAPGTSVAGELVQVVRDLVTRSPRSAVVVESPLPGGFEAADADLGTGGTWVRELESSAGARRELRDDRVVYFFDALPAGITT